MEQWEKQLRKIPSKDRGRLLEVLELLFQRKFSSFDRQRLKGYQHIYRIRVGNYRILYFDDGTDIILKALKRRNEATYSDF